MNLFDLTLRLNGYPINKARSLLHDIQRQDHDEYESFIENRKQEIVAYHLKHSPFYKKLIGNKDVSSWDSIPVMTKRDLQRPLEERLSDNFSKKGVYVNKTSGSSGDPFVFAKDKFCHAMTWAIIQNRFGWFNLDFNTSKQARFYGIPLDGSGYYKERLKDLLSNRFRFSIFDLSDEALHKSLKKFESTSFDYINGYTSAIVQFAKFLKKEGVVLKKICNSLKVCIVTSEMLFEDDKFLMERQFGVPIVNEYGASELDLIAFQNNKKQWQLNSETLFVEILDENNKSLKNGQEGRIVITSLFNKAHPFIRYDIGDIGVISTDSTMKTPILENLVGRNNDIILLPSGKKAAGLTFYYVTKSIIEDDGNVKEFIIEQLKSDTFKIIYSGQEEITRKKKIIISNEIERYLEKGLNIIYERRLELKRSKSGKLKQFSSLIQNN